jgi:hypothetical protein
MPPPVERLVVFRVLVPAVVAAAAAFLSAETFRAQPGRVPLLLHIPACHVEAVRLAFGELDLRVLCLSLGVSVWDSAGRRGGRGGWVGVRRAEED